MAGQLVLDGLIASNATHAPIEGGGPGMMLG